MVPASSNMMVPTVENLEYEVADIDEDDDFVTLVQADGELKQNLKLPKENE